jgi:hypothetical protein
VSIISHASGGWRLPAFDSVYLRDEIAPVMPGQSVGFDPEFFVLLSRIWEFPVRNDLAGVDRPDLVDALARKIYGWAGLTPPR